METVLSLPDRVITPSEADSLPVADQVSRQIPALKASLCDVTILPPVLFCQLNCSDPPKRLLSTSYPLYRPTRLLAKDRVDTPSMGSVLLPADTMYDSATDGNATVDAAATKT